MLVDEHAIPRVLVCLAGATTSGGTGVIALIVLAMIGVHRSDAIFYGLAGFAAFTAYAELLTVASLASDRRMVTWFGWCVVPGHAAGAAAMGRLAWELGLPKTPAMAGTLLGTFVLAYVARRFAMAIFESCSRKRRAGVCSACGYGIGELGRCPECGAESVNQ